VAYPNYLIKATRAMAPFTTHPYQSVMTIFMDMTIKGTNSSWSFRRPGLGRTSAQFCYTTPLFLSFTDLGTGPTHDMQRCVWRENNAYPNPTFKITRKFPSRYSMSSTLGFNIATSMNTQIFTHTNIYIPGIRSCTAN